MVQPGSTFKPTHRPTNLPASQRRIQRILTLIPRDHTTLHRRSLDLHRLIVATVRQTPVVLLRRVRQTLARWRAQCDPRAQALLAAWQQLFERGDEAALATAVEDSKRARELRRSSPCSCVSTPAARHQFFRDWSAAQPAVADQQRTILAHGIVDAVTLIAPIRTLARPDARRQTLVRWVLARASV